MSVFNAALESSEMGKTSDSGTRSLARVELRLLGPAFRTSFQTQMRILRKQDLKAWLEAWDDDFTAAGYGAVARNQVPFDLCSSSRIGHFWLGAPGEST